MNASTKQLDGPKQFLLIASAILVLFLIIQLNSPDLSGVRSVSALDAKKLIDNGAIVVDVRGRNAYEGRHIPGAISIPLSTLEQGVPKSIAQDLTKPVVVYCGDGVTMGPEGTAVLNSAGLVNAVNLGPGIQGWADAGLPVKQGPGA